MKLKLDLHTHCYEATRYAAPTVDLVREILEAAKSKGLDGIGITEHWDKEYGFRVKEIVETCFDNQLLIIPGHELDVGDQQIVELFLPNDSVFRFLAHPGYPSEHAHVEEKLNLQGIEIENSMHSWHINKEVVRELAEKHDLMLLRNSDAHYLSRIGQAYNEISLEDLYARAKPA